MCISSYTRSSLPCLFSSSSSCTNKYHLPAHFELKKGKEIGCSRVCHTCSSHCIKRREEELTAASIKKHGVKHTVLSVNDLNEKKKENEEIVRPIWQTITKTSVSTTSTTRMRVNHI
jgi:hypothetical protein